MNSQDLRPNASSPFELIVFVLGQYQHEVKAHNSSQEFMNMRFAPPLKGLLATSNAHAALSCSDPDPWYTFSGIEALTCLCSDQL